MCKRLLFSTINANTALAIVTKAEGKVQFFHSDLFEFLGVTLCKGASLGI